jgi:hypothetical protein
LSYAQLQNLLPNFIILLTIVYNKSGYIYIYDILPWH